MEYVVFDLEWNQPADEAAAVTDPVVLSGEIVQIGAVKLNEKFEAIDELRLLIKPKYYEKMHRFIASLTGVRDKDLQKQGLSFPEACEQFFAWCGEEFTFITWSLSDLPVLVENMQVFGMDVSNLPDLIDLQRIFSKEIMRTEARHSLDHALEILNEKGDRAHDALHDSRNTVKVCNHIDMEAYKDRYLTRLFVDLDELPDYDEPRQLTKDPLLRGFLCPWCGAEAECEEWLPGSHHRNLAYARCTEGDEFLVTMNAQRVGDRFRAKRFIYDMSDDFWDHYCDVKEREELRRSRVST